MINLTDIVKSLEASWGADTAFDANDWTPENPARGQCVVSSLIVQDFLGGELMRYSVDEKDLHETHYCNQLDDGTIIDTTGKQYKSPVGLRIKLIERGDFESIRDKLLSDESTRSRYQILRERVDLQFQDLTL